MNLTAPEGTSLTEALFSVAEIRRDVDVVLCPSFPSLHAVGALLRNSLVQLGAQDVFWGEKGAFTGQVSAAMLTDAGCTHCIVGHSERRGRFGASSLAPELLPYFADTDGTVGLKLRRLLFANIHPILCVGETLEEREAGRTEDVVRLQLEGALSGVDAAETFGLAVAYEPVWAIGTGSVCDAGEANRVCGFIRSRLAERLSPEAADQIRVLYGGSVNSKNAAPLFRESDIDGALVGAGSLKAAEFGRIVLAA